jgi:L,D-transpeptidase ErfK/SrfK
MSVPTTPPRDSADKKRTRPFVRTIIGVAVAAAMVKVLLGGVVVASLGFSLEPVAVGGVVTDSTPSSPEVAKRERDVRSLEEALRNRAPRRAWIVVDRANNRLWVRTRKGVLLDAVVSTGSGAILRERGRAGREERSWTFDTPSGRFRILGERHDPVWVKPDWAFLEEGQMPPKVLADRRDEGSLGEWALDLGDGYMIHGTLYERLLGRSTTHGCIRVGSRDLDSLVSLVHPGTPVFIF